LYIFRKEVDRLNYLTTEDGKPINENNPLDVKGSVQLSGSYVRLSTEPLPTVADGVQDGNDLLVVDPADKNNNKVYVYRTGAWREI
jgi:hypothetical protein